MLLDRPLGFSWPLLSITNEELNFESSYSSPEEKVAELKLASFFEVRLESYCFYYPGSSPSEPSLGVAFIPSTSSEIVLPLIA